MKSVLISEYKKNKLAFIKENIKKFARKNATQNICEILFGKI